MTAARIDNKAKSGAKVVAVSASKTHNFSKQPQAAIIIGAGLGVEGDAHAGDKVQHLSRVAANPGQPNLRQVHLIHAELFDGLQQLGFAIHPGMLGENITTRGLNLLDLPQGALLRLGGNVVLQVTGLRNPCAQIEQFRPGLLTQLARKGEDGAIIRLAGIMCTALTSGTVRPGDTIIAERPAGAHKPLEPV